MRALIGRPLLASCLVLGALCAAPLANAQDAATYPDKPVKVLVGFSPGGGSDTVARILAEPLAKILGQSFVVENRPGAGGQVARTLLSEAAPDGYTILADSASFTSSAVLTANLGYDPIKDIRPVAQIASTPVVFVATPSLPAATVEEVIALAKAKPGELGYATSGVGSLLHFSGELLNSMAGTKILHVPYKGAEGMTDLVAGRVQLAFAGLPQTLSLIRAGKLRALGVTTTEASENLPGVPVMAVAVPGYEVNNWYGIFAPAGTPDAIVEKLNAAVGQALQDPQVREKLAAQGLTASARPAGEFASYVAAEIGKWERVAKEAGIAAQ